MILDFLKLGKFWKKQELSNQFVHQFFGFWTSTIMWFGVSIFGFNIFTSFGHWSLLGFIIPFTIEFARQNLMESPEYEIMYLWDKIRDCFFYGVGSAMTLVFFPVI